jgi:DnaJ-domain-containing protein 1
MRIPFWIWLVLGLSLLSWIIPDGIPGEEFILPAIAGIGLLMRLRMLRFYQNQFNQYRQQQARGTGAGPFGGAGQGSSSFYSRFRNWNANAWSTAGGSGSGAGTGTFGGSARDPHEVLGVSRGASMDEIKKAHRDKLKLFHPDIIASKKLGPEYQQFFEEKTREINEAYKQLGGK